MAINKFSTFIILFFSLIYQGQTAAPDNLDWIYTYPTFNSFNVSPDGQWYSLNRQIANQSVETLVYNTKKPNHPKYIINLKGANTELINDHIIMVKNSSTAEVIWLNTGKKWSFDQNTKCGYLPHSNEFYTWTEDKVFTLYGMDNKINTTYNSIEKIITKNKHTLILQKNDSNYRYINPSNPYNQTYTSLHPASYLNYTDNHWILIHKESNDDQKLVLLDTLARKVAITTFNSTEKPASITIIPSDKPAKIVLNVVYNFKTTDKMLVDIWSTKDTLLKYKRSGLPNVQLANWDLKANTLQWWENTLSTCYIPISHTSSSIKYSLEERDNYQYPTSYVNLYIHNNNSHQNTAWTKHTDQIIFSQDNSYAIAYNHRDKVWDLWSQKNRVSYKISKSEIENPIFSLDNKSIYFTKGNQLWRYTIRDKRFTLLLDKKASSIKIENVKYINHAQYPGIQTATVFLNDPKFIKVSSSNKDGSYNMSYITPTGKETIIYKNINAYINKAVMLNDHKTALVLQEEHNIPPYVIKYSNNGTRADTLTKTIRDPIEKKLKKELIQYTTHENEKLKAILYYPKNFDKNKKYPLIVHVYEKQSTKMNKYLLPRIEFDGFSPRIFIENDYFVLLPDINIKGKVGAGKTAIAQLKVALKAVEKNPNIDTTKMGLHGHSFGGYQTNLAAAEPLKFAAYISGSSIASIISKYYTYYENLQLPEFARIENAQFSMIHPLKDHLKEYMDNDPLTKVHNVKAPILLWCGLDDTNTPPNETMAFYLGLLKNKKDAVALFYRNQQHSFSLFSDAGKDLTLRSLQWWDYFLKDNKNIEWINNELKKEAP